MYSTNQITSLIIESAIQVHRSLGPGLLESVYKSCLYDQLISSNLAVEKEIPIPVVYEGRKLECGFRADLIVNKTIVVEVKAIELIHDVHKAQLLTYLRLTNLRFGLIINFNVVLLKHGIKRIVNGY